MSQFTPSDPNGIRARKAVPDGTLVQDPWGPRGQEVSRTLRKVCPWCESSFYTFQVFGQEKAPGQVDPMPPVVGDTVLGYRATCGSPDCWQLEQDHQLRRSPMYQRAVSQASNELREAEVKPLLTKGGYQRSNGGAGGMKPVGSGR